MLILLGSACLPVNSATATYSCSSKPLFLVKVKIACSSSSSSAGALTKSHLLPVLTSFFFLITIFFSTIGSNSASKLFFPALASNNFDFVR